MLHKCFEINYLNIKSHQCSSFERESENKASHFKLFNSYIWSFGHDIHQLLLLTSFLLVVDDFQVQLNDCCSRLFPDRKAQIIATIHSSCLKWHKTYFYKLSTSNQHINVPIFKRPNLTYPKYSTSSECFIFNSEIVVILINLYPSQNITIMNLLNRNAHKYLLKQVFICWCGEIKCFCQPHGFDFNKEIAALIIIIIIDRRDSLSPCYLTYCSIS